MEAAAITEWMFVAECPVPHDVRRLDLLIAHSVLGA